MGASGYVTAIKGLGLTVLAEADLGYYQGDWVGLVRNDEYSSVGHDYGFIVVGYGSCSGCDAWQAADDATERAAILARVINDAKWFESQDEARDYIVNAAANNVGYFVHEDDWSGFVIAVQEATR